MDDNDTLAVRPCAIDDVEFRWVGENGFCRKTLAGIKQSGPASACDFGGLVRGGHRNVIEFVALDDVCVDERSRKTQGDADLTDCRFPGAIGIGKKDKAGPHAGSSPFA